MAVTKTSVVSVLVVLAITYNQGAARPMDSGTYITKNGLSSSSEEQQADSVGERTYKFPTVIKQGLAITINGTIDPSDATFIVELPSISSKNKCQLKFDYEKKRMSITPAIEPYSGSTEYDLNITGQSPEGPSFSLRIVARRGPENHLFGMTFFNNVVGESSQLLCIINNFEDINQIVIKKGVAHVDSLLFESLENH